MPTYLPIATGFPSAQSFTSLIFEPRKIQARRHIDYAERLAYSKPSNSNTPVSRYIFLVCGWLVPPILRRKPKPPDTTRKTNHNAQRRNAIPNRIDWGIWRPRSRANEHWLSLTWSQSHRQYRMIKRARKQTLRLLIQSECQPFLTPPDEQNSWFVRLWLVPKNSKVLQTRSNLWVPSCFCSETMWCPPTTISLDEFGMT